MELDKKTRLMIAGGAGVLVLLIALFVFWPSGDADDAPAPEVVQAAVEASKQAQEQAPPVPEDPALPQGRARPRSMSGQ